MHGPYTIQIRSGRYDGPVVVELSEEDARGETAAIATAHRFYSDASVGLVDGALRVGVFAAAALLLPGEEATVQIVGSVGSESGVQVREARARRDDLGHFYTTLGSRFNERRFIGV